MQGWTFAPGWNTWNSTPAASTSRRTTSSTWAVLPFFLGLPLMATIFINFPSIIWFPLVVPPL